MLGAGATPLAEIEIGTGIIARETGTEIRIATVTIAGGMMIVTVTTAILLGTAVTTADIVAAMEMRANMDIRMV